MTIRIGPMDVRLRALYPREDIAAFGKRACGLFYRVPPHEIAIQADIEPVLQADTLIHEIIHGIFLARGMAKRVTEERACNQIAEGLIEVFVANPKILRAIQLAISDNQPIVTSKGHTL